MNRMTDLSGQARADFGWLLPAALMEPYHLTHPAPWAGHIPFAAWLMAVAQPRSLVELGPTLVSPTWLFARRLPSRA